MLRQLYRQLPIPENIRQWISSHLPEGIRREPQLRAYGVINDLYLWRTDSGIDTIAPIQNFFSALFPHLDTATRGHVWFFDQAGQPISEHSFELPHMGFHELRLSDFVPTDSYGSFMWHIRMPNSVADDPLVKDGRVYFTDRGYICFEKDKCQPAFMHGIDRYSVFQKQAVEEYDHFYSTDTNRTWLAEFPLSIDMQEKTEIVLINRSSAPKKYELSIYQSGHDLLSHREINVASRGIGIFTITQNDISRLGTEQGYFSVNGIPTPWGRPAIMRYFKSGAISVMHC